MKPFVSVSVPNARIYSTHSQFQSKPGGFGVVVSVSFFSSVETNGIHTAMFHWLPGQFFVGAVDVSNLLFCGRSWSPPKIASSIALALASRDALLASRRREVEEFTCTLQSVVIPQDILRDPIRKVPRWRATRNVGGNLRSGPGACT